MFTRDIHFDEILNLQKQPPTKVQQYQESWQMGEERRTVEWEG
jgi:hypothetical protein